MIKCAKCNREGTTFAFKDGRVIYACNHDRTRIKKDQITDWLRIAKIRRVK